MPKETRGRKSSAFALLLLPIDSPRQRHKPAKLQSYPSYHPCPKVLPNPALIPKGPQHTPLMQGCL